MTPTSVFLTTPYGGTVQLIYSWTFGEMAITCVLLAMTVLYAVNWLYDIVRQLWIPRRAH
jgi:hypothetical protein